MKSRIFFMMMILAAVVPSAAIAQAQQSSKETYTGTIISFGSGRNTRTSTGTFTLELTGATSDVQAGRFLSVLIEGGQDSLLETIKNENLGRFSITGNLGRQINGVRISEVDGKKRIVAIFERWLQFAEVRGGYRSVDYPFSIIEIFVDPVTGKGEGTFIAAARVRWVRDKKTDDYQVEIENFGTFPAKLMGISRRNR